MCASREQMYLLVTKWEAQAEILYKENRPDSAAKADELYKCVAQTKELLATWP